MKRFLFTGMVFIMSLVINNNALAADTDMYANILNKMDGTSKGGIALSIVDNFDIPVSFIGVGEKMDHLVKFDSDDYIKSLIVNDNT